MLTTEQKKTIKRQLKRQKIRSARKLVISASPGATVAYYRNLKSITVLLEKWTEELILPFLEKRESEYFKDDIGFDLSKSFSEFEKRIDLLELGQTGVELIEGPLQIGDNFNRRAFLSGLKKVLGVNVSKMLNEDRHIKKEFFNRINENIDLIKTIPTKYLDSLKETIKQGINEGDDYQSIRKSILKLGQSTKKRAKFIARDQLSKYNNNLNQIRQENIGITKYIWRTAGDRRVSKDHAKNEGRIFSWDNPPPTGHPGERPNCRCVAEPYVDDLLKEINRQNLS